MKPNRKALFRAFHLVEKSGELSNFFDLDLHAILAYASEIRLVI